MNNTIWKGAAGYTIGRSHIKEQKPCQDRTLVVKRNGLTFVGVCDGAGSASYSHYGAETALNVVSDYILDSFAECFELEEHSMKSQIIEAISMALTHLASEYSVEKTAFASTLLFVVANETHYISGHLGDGLIVALKQSAVIHSYPDNGAYANVTYFTTSLDAVERLRIERGELNDITGFCLMSDGTSHSMFRKQDDFIAPAILTIMRWLNENEENDVSQAIERNLEKSISQKTFDDCALAVMVRC